jgi:low affinity Fe/Cu permease
MSEWFTRFANRASAVSGHYLTFLFAFALIIFWAVSGPFFHFSETWQLVINTGTTIITFLMVFLIQNTQNRDALAIHLKLDEIIHSIDAADDAIINAEDQTTEQLQLLRQKYEALCDEHAELKAKLGIPGANGATAAPAASRG